MTDMFQLLYFYFSVILFIYDSLGLIIPRNTEKRYSYPLPASCRILLNKGKYHP